MKHIWKFKKSWENQNLSGDLLDFPLIVKFAFITTRVQIIFFVGKIEWTRRKALLFIFIPWKFNVSAYLEILVRKN